MNTKRILYTLLVIALTFSTSAFSQESQEIDKVLEQRRAYNKENPTGNGFKIQLYNGNETEAY